MSLIKWSPFFEPLDETDQLLQGMRSALTPTSRPVSGGLIPLVDVYEMQDALMVEAPMPGIDPKNIELSIDHGVLSIKATNERKTEIDEKTYYRKEVRHGTVFRQINLPSLVQEDAAEASYENGVLKIRLPKRPESSTPIKVEIRKN